MKITIQFLYGRKDLNGLIVNDTGTISEDASNNSYTEKITVIKERIVNNNDDYNVDGLYNLKEM